MQKPRVRFYSNGLLIIDVNNDYSLKWYIFDLNRVMLDSILWMPYKRMDYKLNGKITMCDQTKK